jgi:hypothetical protein
MKAMPSNALVAIAIALMPLPAMKLLNHLNQGCGDGLCGFFSGLLILGGLAAATVVFVVRSARRNEQVPALRLAPLVLWLGSMYALAI